MYEVAEYIYEYIVIMSIFYVEVILDKTISCQTLDEVSQRGLPVCTEDLLVDVFEASLSGDFFQVAYCSSIIDELDQTTVGTVRDYGIWSYPDLDILFLEDVIEQTYELHRHVLLS